MGALSSPVANFTGGLATGTTSCVMWGSGNRIQDLGSQPKSRHVTVDPQKLLAGLEKNLLEKHEKALQMPR